MTKAGARELVPVLSLCEWFWTNSPFVRSLLQDANTAEVDELGQPCRLKRGACTAVTHPGTRLARAPSALLRSLCSPRPGQSLLQFGHSLLQSLLSSDSRMPRCPESVVPAISSTWIRREVALTTCRRIASKVVKLHEQRSGDSIQAKQANQTN